MFWISLTSGITVPGTESNNKHKSSHLDFSHGLMSTVGIWPMDKIMQVLSLSQTNSASGRYRTKLYWLLNSPPSPTVQSRWGNL